MHNGIDPEAFGVDAASARPWLRKLLAVAAGVPVIGCVGRLSAEKDQATFIRALAILRDLGQPYHAVLVGDGPTEPALRALAMELGLGDQVVFLGARADARRILAGLDVLALTSQIEGFPNVLLEAGFLGVPIVSTNAGGVMDVVDDTEGLCPCGDARAVAEALASALRDPARRAARAGGQAARCHERFTAGHMVARWTALYEREPAPERPAT